MNVLMYLNFFDFQVKKERHDKFIECFEHVANEIDAIYKVHIISHSLKLVVSLYCVISINLIRVDAAVTSQPSKFHLQYTDISPVIFESHDKGQVYF